MGIVAGSAASDEAGKEKPRGFFSDYQGTREVRGNC